MSKISETGTIHWGLGEAKCGSSVRKDGGVLIVKMTTDKSLVTCGLCKFHIERAEAACVTPTNKIRLGKS